MPLGTLPVIIMFPVIFLSKITNNIPFHEDIHNFDSKNHQEVRWEDGGTEPAG
jgi:hypothetical protein